MSGMAERQGLSERRLAASCGYCGTFDKHTPACQAARFGFAKVAAYDDETCPEVEWCNEVGGHLVHKA